MQCPACSTVLRIVERHRIDIDYCPQCRGVWLDRGELDKIIERASAVPSHRAYEDEEEGEFFGRDREAKERYGRKGRRRSFLGELFDFE